MLLIIPDIHEELEMYHEVMKKYHYITRKLSLGDWYDSFIYDSADHAEEVARTHADFVSNPDNICLWGNHDAQYAYPNCSGIHCSGFGAWKINNIDKWMKPLWDKIQLAHWETLNGREWLMSHAGFHPFMYHPIRGFDRERLAELCAEAMTSVKYAQTITPTLSVGRRRGGWHRYGGCTWLDFRDFEAIPGINQIVGHTYGKIVREYRTNDSENYCIDTGLKNVAILDDDGTCTIEEV
jgi:hypothetical protein